MAKEVGTAKEFILGGFVADVAIGGLIGAAITPFIASTIDDIIMPLFGLVSGYKLKKQFTLLEKGHTEGAVYRTKEQAISDGAIVMPYGNFLYSAIKFVSVIGIAFGTAKIVSKLRKTNIQSWWIKPASPQAAPQPVTQQGAKHPSIGALRLPARYQVT